MSDIKVSVIIPVYNGGKYLEKSLLFLCRQTLADIEFILVNDASTDNSLDIMTAFKMAFPEKFIVLNMEKNKGPGGARNAGLSYARGEYIGFVDCDDFTNPEMFELMYNKAKEKDSDIVMCAYRHKGVNDDVFINTDLFKNGFSPQARSELVLYTGFLWHSIFRKDFLTSLDMLFRESYIYEDIDFLFEVYSKAESIAFVKKSLYLYNDNSESLSHKKTEPEKMKIIMDELFTSIIERCEASVYYSEIKEAIQFKMLRLSADLLGAIIENNGLSLKNIEDFNNLLKKYTGGSYTSNKYIARNDVCEEDKLAVIRQYNTNSEKFFNNLKKLNIRV